MTVSSLGSPISATTEPRSSHPDGRSQHNASPKGLQHTDFQVTYDGKKTTADLFKQTFRMTGRAGGRTFDLGPLVEQLTWQDQSADELALTNIRPELTGSIQLRKPTLHQYRSLLSPLLAATVAGGAAREGALGAQVICEVGYGRSFVPMWAMRCASTADGNAEAVNLEDGTWTLSLADDLFQIGLSLDDFKFTSGKKVRKQGWRAHEIAAAVAHQYAIPVKQLARGTSWVSLPVSSTSSVSPSEVISAAYQAETDKTGRVFVMRWAAPDKKHPGGALEVVPMRRNPNLLTVREQLTNAALSRDTNPDFATVITGTAVLKHPTGKHHQIEYKYHSAAAVKRFGYIHKKIPFQTVSSELELQILVKRALAWRLSPLRQAELTHPGLATVRRGDAIRIDLPEEGYSSVPLDTYSTPTISKAGRKKYSVLALAQAQKDDPSLFGLPDPTTLTATGAAATPTGGNVNTVTPEVVLVADQGIAFVKSAAHTVSAGSYSMDLITGFVDVLDPLAVRAQVDATVRSAKAQRRKKGK